MNSSEHSRRKQALLTRWLDGEIDKRTYDQMLAQLDAAVADSSPGSEEPKSLGQYNTLGGETGGGDSSSPSSSPHKLRPGETIGRFRLEILIGRGGMGEVWKALDETGKRFVVIKVVPADVQNADEEMARVKESFDRVEALHHQHICPIYMLEKDDKHGYFLVMQYLDGQTLSAYRRTYFAQHGSFPLAEVVRLLEPVAAGLDYAHAHKVIHRDVKPQNIMVIKDGHDVQLVDFGLAAEIRESMTNVSNVRMNNSGTRPYMAPEQWRGEYQDAKTDQYALAVVAYELLSGHRPYRSNDFDILRACVLNDPAPSISDQPEHVDRVLARALAKRRAERFESCREFIQALANPGAKVAPPPLPSVALAPPVFGTQGAAPGGPSKIVVPSQQRQMEKLITNSVGMKLAYIPAGEFLMGSPENEPGRSGDEKQHKVRITKPYYLGVTQVTQEQWQSLMGSNPSKFSGAQHPVEQVSWLDCQQFIEKLNGRCPMEGYWYSLPTEAEWEYACRAGSAAAYCFGGDERPLSQYAWYDANSGSTTHPVGQKKANAWGLYDMHGNVWEWCSDWYDENYYGSSAPADPQGPNSGSGRVPRGGSWNGTAARCRSANRYRFSPDLRFLNLGFRIALVPSS